jgi:hypothetical protein
MIHAWLGTSQWFQNLWHLKTISVIYIVFPTKFWIRLEPISIQHVLSGPWKWKQWIPTESEKLLWILSSGKVCKSLLLYLERTCHLVREQHCINSSVQFSSANSE